MSSGPQPAGSTDEPVIVPRWEWRTFGEPLASAEAVLDAHAPDLVRESEEVYLLSVSSDTSVKVREGLMDVKELLEVDDDGLQLWRPVMKATFPLSAGDVACVLGALEVEPRGELRDSYTLDAFEAELVTPNDRLITAPVHKRRTHYIVDGCMVELTQLTTGDVTVRTLAIESPDPSLVATTIEKVGLADRRNGAWPWVSRRCCGSAATR